MSNERTPLLGEKVLVDIEEHHRYHYSRISHSGQGTEIMPFSTVAAITNFRRLNNEPDNLHDQREHHLHHHDHHNHHHGHYQSVGQEGDARVEAGEGGDSEITGLLDGNEDILEDAEKTTDPYTIIGFAFSVLAGICFTSSNVMVKYLHNVSSWELLFVRCSIQMLSMLPLMACFHKNPLGPPDFPTRARIGAQGALGGILLFCIFEAVADLPLGDATAIFFSSPAFTMVLSTCILRDHCGLFRTLVATSLLSGVVILSRPPSIFPPSPDQPVHPHHNITAENSNATQPDTDHDPNQGGYSLFGLLAALAVPTLSAVIVIITRQAKHVHYSVLVFWFAVGGLIVSIIGIQCIDKRQTNIFTVISNWNNDQWVLTFLIALVGLIGSILMTKAVCWVTPSKVMVVRSFEVVVAYILQKTIILYDTWIFQYGLELVLIQRTLIGFEAILVTVFDTPTHTSDVFGTLLVILAVLSMGLEDPLMRRYRWRFL